MKVVLQEQKEADTKSSKLESESTAMKAKSEVPKETTSEGDGHIRNESKWDLSGQESPRNPAGMTIT